MSASLVGSEMCIRDRIYVVYLNYTGQEVPQNMDDLKESVSEKVEKVKEKTAESINEAKESTRKVVEEKVEEKLDELLGG